MPQGVVAVHKYGQICSIAHTKFAVFLSWCAGKSDNDILRQIQVDALITFYRDNNRFLTVYKKGQSIRLHAHSQLYPLLPGEWVFLGEVKAGKALSSSPELIVQTQSVIEGGGDDLENW